MRARIIELNEFTLLLKDENGQYMTIERERLDFEYQLGDTVEMESGEDGRYHFRVFGGNEPLDGPEFAVKESVKPVPVKELAPVGQKVGGWLLVSIIFPIWIIVSIVSGIFQDGLIIQLSPEACDILNQQFNNSCSPYTTNMILNSIFNILIAGLGIAAIVTIFRRQKIGKLINIIFYIVRCAWTIIYFTIFFIIDAVYHLPNEIITEIRLFGIASIAIMGLAAVIWIPYFIKSERVKDTLVR